MIRTPPTDDLPLRLAALHAELEALVDELHPSVVVVERVLFQVNARTAIVGRAGERRGADRRGTRGRVPVVHYSPNEVKLAVAGYGGADKAQVADMVARLLALSGIPGPPDAADVLALALCHAGAGRTQRGRPGGPWSGTGPRSTAVAAALRRRPMNPAVTPPVERPRSVP